MPCAGALCFSLVFIFSHVGYNMVTEYVIMIGLGFLIGMIVTMGIM